MNGDIELFSVFFMKLLIVLCIVLVGLVVVL